MEGCSQPYREKGLLVDVPCSHLQEVSLRYSSSYIDNRTILHISEHCTDLRVLRMTGCQDIQGLCTTGLSAIAERCPLLRLVDFAHCVWIEDEFLFSLAQHTRALEYLSIPRCRSITAEGVERVLRGCPLLNELCLSSALQRTVNAVSSEEVIKECFPNVLRVIYENEDTA
jgi:hypothetical protein